MGTLGKVLIVLVLLAGAGFVYLAVADWSERQEWAYTAFRHELAIRGLPVEDGPDTGDPDTVAFPFGFENAGGLTEISRESLGKIFAFPAAAAPEGAAAGLGGPGEPVASQLAEVRRVRQRTSELVNQADGPAAKLNLLRRFLINQARTLEERQRLAALTADPGNLDPARRELERRFDEVLAEPSPTADPAQATRFAGQRRAAIAHLLYHLDPDDPTWQRRVLTVVGLETFADVLAAQADRMVAMVQDVRSAIRDEQGRFEPAYRELVEHSRHLSRRLEELVGKINEQKFLIGKHTTLRDARRAEAEKLQEDLRIVKADARKELAEQEELEKTLYQTQVQLGAALDAIARLERELHDLQVTGQ